MASEFQNCSIRRNIVKSPSPPAAVMTFKGLLMIFASSCLEASLASTVGPAAYTTIRNTIDIMGAVESAQENNAGSYGRQHVYATYSETGNTSNSKISELDQPTLPDVFSNSQNTLRHADLHRLTSVPGISSIVASAGPSFSYVAASGPSIIVSAGLPGIRTISYSAPGGVFVSHGTPGTSYVLSQHRPARLPAPSSSSSPFSTETDSRIPQGSYSLHSEANGNVVIAGNLHDPKSIINLVAARDSATATGTEAYGHIGLHPAHVAAYRNLEAARKIVGGIFSSLYLRGLNN